MFLTALQVFSRRQINIESISVGPTEVKDVSRVTVIVDVENLDEVEQIIKQLNRLIDVVRVPRLTEIPHLEREVILVKISAPPTKRAEILAIIQPFRANVRNVAPHSITIQMTGDGDKIEATLTGDSTLWNQEYCTDRGNWFQQRLMLTDNKHYTSLTWLDEHSFSSSPSSPNLAFYFL